VLAMEGEMVVLAALLVAALVVIQEMADRLTE
jgi:hypothetical protein